MNILVTGGAGYIGTHVALELLAAGWEPVLLDNFSNASPTAMPALARLAGRTLRCVEGDIRDPKCLDGVLERHDISAVVASRGAQGGGRVRRGAVALPLQQPCRHNVPA